MKIFGPATFFVALFSVLLLVVVTGIKALSLVANVSPVVAQVVEDLTPKIVQTPTRVIIFENPLVDQEGLSVSEVLDRRQELVGKEVTIKGRQGKGDREWGFWLTDTGETQREIFVINNNRIVSQNIAEFTLSGQTYLRVKGTIKEMIWTDEDSTIDVNNPDGISGRQESRLVIVPSEISSIVLE